MFLFVRAKWSDNGCDHDERQQKRQKSNQHDHIERIINAGIVKMLTHHRARNRSAD